MRLQGLIISARLCLLIESRHHHLDILLILSIAGSEEILLDPAAIIFRSCVRERSSFFEEISFACVMSDLNNDILFSGVFFL